MFDKYKERFAKFEEDHESIRKIKQHFERNQQAYFFGGGVVFAGITSLIVRDTVSQCISRGIPVAAQGGIPVLGESNAIQNVVTGKHNVLNSVSYISANRQGPPSWVVRCLDTGDVFTSQKIAAAEMGLPANELSRHLNGILDNVRGYHFERICLAA
jgi:hypothetical protein